ncbi:hypothetical protein JM946_15475 [Steroidobacter sp. S1-65]|uniref:Uncharacterized protein n=1 Tax=Steroidobacter gossypii TaxID=2805490 RepID=A0ABS1WYS9_9GAMM|nr:hypothetical protein [Steroidobacter gossypii]MBM0106134.1 hypothetical protein [Steroidobacter gossypii]
MQHRFTATTFLVSGGLLVWMANFTFVYVFAALACARGFADVDLLGLPVVPLASLVATSLAGAVTAMIVRRGLVLHRESDEHTRFIGFVTWAGGALALVALVLLVIPALVVSACPQY